MQLNLYHRLAEIEINAQELFGKKNYDIDINNVGQKINNIIILKKYFKHALKFNCLVGSN